MNLHRFKKRQNYQRVLLAVYWLADEDGLRCHATNAELAAETGLAAETVRHYLWCLEFDGLVSTSPTRDRPPRRTLVLLDHEDAPSFLERAEKDHKRAMRRSKTGRKS